MNQPHYYLFGDSLTELGLQEGGWIHFLLERFGRTALCIPRGRSGYNSSWLLSDLDNMADPKLSAAPSFITLLIGSNDCCTTTHQAVDIDKYEQNINDIVKKFTDLYNIASERIYLITPPPTLDEDRIKVSVYADTVRKVASERGTTLIDLWNSDWDEDCFVDGLHFSGKGNYILASKVLYSLKEDVISELDCFSWDHWSVRS